MKRIALGVLGGFALSALVAWSPAAHAADTIKIGFIAEFSGAFADAAREMDDGIKLYMKEHGDTVAGKKIEIIRRDTGGPKPEEAKRLAQELIVRDNVDFLAGFVVTPNALAVADVITQAKKPTVIMNAATSIITTKSPYFVRVSFTVPQVTAPLAVWATKNGVKQAYTMVSDYGPGIDAENSFKKAFEANGGTIVGSVRMPLTSPEFSAYAQKVKDLNPQAVFVFVPSNDQPTQLMKTFAERGLTTSTIKIIATGDVTEDAVLEQEGDAALGMITSHHYSYAHDSQLNKQFVAAFAQEYGTLRPDFLAVDGYDGMAAIYAVIEKLKGDVSDPDKVMEAFKGLKIESPRGPITIDPETRDVIQTVYIRKVERKDGKLVNVEFDKIENVKDPGK